MTDILTEAMERMQVALLTYCERAFGISGAIGSDLTHSSFAARRILVRICPSAFGQGEL